MLFDSHAHYDDKRFDKDRGELLSILPQNEVSLVLNASCDMESAKTAIALTKIFPHVYASVGTHPHEADAMTDDDLFEYELLAKDPKVVAIGEIGLDFHYDFSPRDIQRQRFRQQMQLAEKLNMPVIIHDREAHGECMQIIKEYPSVKGVFHCYSGSPEMAKELVKMGWYLSFTGVITYKNARKTHEVIQWMPEDRIMIETDSPYLSPEPVRKQRNDSRNVKYVAEKIAELRGWTYEDTARITTENAKRCFGI